MARRVSVSEKKAVGEDLGALLPDDNRPWYAKKNLIKLNFSLLSLILFSSANGYDGSMMNGLQALHQWQAFMQHPTGAWLVFINAAQSLGAFVGYPVVAWFSNRYGRKKTIAIGYFWLLLGVGLQAGAQNQTMFVLGRLFLGQVSAWYAGAAPLLITETAYPTHRGVATALYNCGWYVGSLIAAWATFGTRNYSSSWAWRIPLLLQIAIPVVQLVRYVMSPESPRWLVSKGRVDEARLFLVQYHADGDENAPLVAFELEEIERTLKNEAELAQSTSYLNMFKTKGNRHRFFISVTLGIFAQWNGVGVVSYYLALVLETAGITSVTNQTMISGFLQIWNHILSVIAACLVDKLGRRFLFMTSCLGMLTSYIVISGLSGSFANTGNKATGLAVIPMLFLYYGFYDIAFTPLLISYTSEIWNFSLRARGLAVCLISPQLAVFFNIFVNPIALEAIAWKYYIVFAVLFVIISFMVYFCYPETRGHTLEEMARVFDGDEAAVPHEGEVVSRIAASGNDDLKWRLSGAAVHIESFDDKH